MGSREKKTLVRVFRILPQFNQDVDSIPAERLAERELVEAIGICQMVMAEGIR